MIDEFLEVAGGSIIGTSHISTSKNNQDSFYYEPNLGIVCDGCGSSAKSEVGANLIIPLMVKMMKEDGFVPNVKHFNKMINDLLAIIRPFIENMNGEFVKNVSEYFLCTIVGFIVKNNYITFFNFGDGVIIINGEMHKIGPFENNAPPYLAYRLIENVNYDPKLLEFRLITRPVGIIENFLIGTDGVLDFIEVNEKTIPGKKDLIGPISNLWIEDKYFGNKEMINRLLRLINRDPVLVDMDNKVILREKGRLPDDTTLIVGRKKREEVKIA